MPHEQVKVLYRRLDGDMLRCFLELKVISVVFHNRVRYLYAGYYYRLGSGHKVPRAMSRGCSLEPVY